MLKKILLGVAALFVVAVAVFGFTVVRPLYGLVQQISPAGAPDDYAKQDDSRVPIPEMEPLATTALQSPEERVLGRTPRPHRREPGRGPLRHGRHSRGRLSLRPGRAAPQRRRRDDAALASARLRGDHGPCLRFRPACPLRRRRPQPRRARELLVHGDARLRDGPVPGEPRHAGPAGARSDASGRRLSQPPATAPRS